MIDPVLFNSLRRFRAGVYGAFGARRDALFELLDAATVAGPWTRWPRWLGRIASPSSAADIRSLGERAAALDILVVDDEPPLAALLSHMLALDGHAVAVEHSGVAALERLEAQAFDVLVSDMGMPGMDGWELTRQVRSRYPSTRIVIASGWGSQITPEEAHEHGVHAVVAKPYRRADIRHAIAALHTTTPSNCPSARVKSDSR
jgi:CheY-like chemotaxis protein